MTIAVADKPLPLGSFGKTHTKTNFKKVINLGNKLNPIVFWEKNSFHKNKINHPPLKAMELHQEQLLKINTKGSVREMMTRLPFLPYNL